MGVEAVRVIRQRSDGMKVKGQGGRQKAEMMEQDRGQGSKRSQRDGQSQGVSTDIRWKEASCQERGRRGPRGKRGAGEGQGQGEGEKGKADGRGERD